MRADEGDAPAHHAGPHAIRTMSDRPPQPIQANGRARLDAAHNPPLAREHLAQAAALVSDTGYHRRDAEIAALERLLSARTA